MSLVMGQNHGVFNGTTEVTIISAPASSTYRVFAAGTFFNADSVGHVFKVYLSVSGTPVEIERSGTIATMGSWQPACLNGRYTLDDPSQSITAKIDASHTTTAPSFICSFQDQS